MKPRDQGGVVDERLNVYGKANNELNQSYSRMLIALQEPKA
jgi:hypothetical protein